MCSHHDLFVKVFLGEKKTLLRKDTGDIPDMIDNHLNSTKNEFPDGKNIFL